ncbi:MAG TPA: endopeptidase La [Spirochaetia bacterium]|nr:endopeptidase La [Spirochaetia bacterium]
MKLKPLMAGQLKEDFPLVPLKEIVVFPHMVVPFFVGRPASIKAVEEAIAGDRLIFLACQKNQSETPEDSDIHTVGTVSKILQMLKLPDGTIRVLAEGMRRGIIVKFLKQKEVSQVRIKPITETRELGPETSALMGTVLESFKRYAQLNKKISPDVVSSVERAEYPDKLIDIICAQMNLKLEKKIEILSFEDTKERLEAFVELLEAENEMLGLQNKINTRVKLRIEKSQREYFLNEQLKQINKELGRGDDEDPSGAKELEAKIKAKNPPKEVVEKAEKECGRLLKLQPMSPESAVLRTYLEWLSDLPWSNMSEDNRDIDRAAAILDEDHFNMKKPKERILDFIAVHQLKEKVKGPILCFVGPPGTGKTSLGKSVARALSRDFVRISLGGLRDEAEIRGHRKTYVGALPGKIIQSMRKASTINPVFLLDEIDKISSDFRGDPASALLEVLDPEQNANFVDHYLEVPYDLSSVMFITTANSIHSIPLPLRDRMEIIDVPGYSDVEKFEIASRFLIPKQISENGLGWADIKFSKNAILSLIRGYTMESGVRNLEREIAEVIRKIAREAVKRGYARGHLSDAAPDAAVEQSDSGSLEPFKVQVTEKMVEKLLGKQKYQEDILYTEARVGLAHGLAWTELGGTVLPVEAAILEGGGELILTGNLGDVMKESAKTALSFIRSQSASFGLPEGFHKAKDIHIHVPEGAIPKDGPSAGITITTALLSALTGVVPAAGIAMTGEITLSGRLLPIGGVKEKVLAAYRNKIMTVLMPEGNRKDTEELPPEVLSEMKFLFADSVQSALSILFPSFAAREAPSPKRRTRKTSTGAKVARGL